MKRLGVIGFVLVAVLCGRPAFAALSLYDVVLKVNVNTGATWVHFNNTVPDFEGLAIDSGRDSEGWPIEPAQLQADNFIAPPLLNWDVWIRRPDVCVAVNGAGSGTISNYVPAGSEYYLGNVFLPGGREDLGFTWASLSQGAFGYEEDPYNYCSHPSPENVIYQSSSVPEPSMLLIWSLLGGLGLAGAWWRKRRASRRRLGATGAMIAQRRARWGLRVAGVAVLLAVVAFPADAPTFSSYSFDGSAGAQPRAGLTLSSDGSTLYGVACYSGAKASAKAEDSRVLPVLTT
jgi:hypothetical protein